jgi:uncharacterized membrane protein (DUF4010 family)
MNFDWLPAHDLAHLPHYLTALAIGLLVGLERERNPTAKAGLRTFALVALSGAASVTLAQALAAPAIVAVGLGAVALMMIAAYYHHHEEWHEQDPGTTTIAAVVACYLLGAMAVAGQPRLALILGILCTALLYFKAELGGAARSLERRDLVSILQFAVVAFVVLPLLPDRGYGPYEALNPRHIWMMVVLISGLSLAGFVALRLVGGHHGAMLLGAFGGMVSTTATTLAYSRQAREGEGADGLAGIVIVTANLVLLLRLALIGAVVAPAVLPVLGPVLALALAAGGIAFAFALRRDGARRELVAPSVGNPVELRSALGFALFYAAVLLLVAWLGAGYPDFGAGGHRHRHRGGGQCGGEARDRARGGRSGAAAALPSSHGGNHGRCYGGNRLVRLIQWSSTGQAGILGLCGTYVGRAVQNPAHRPVAPAAGAGAARVRGIAGGIPDMDQNEGGRRQAYNEGAC